MALLSLGIPGGDETGAGKPVMYSLWSRRFWKAVSIPKENHKKKKKKKEKKRKKLRKPEILIQSRNDGCRGWEWVPLLCWLCVGNGEGKLTSVGTQVLKALAYILLANWKWGWIHDSIKFPNNFLASTSLLIKLICIQGRDYGNTHITFKPNQYPIIMYLKIVVRVLVKIMLMLTIF